MFVFKIVFGCNMFVSNICLSVRHVWLSDMFSCKICLSERDMFVCKMCLAVRYV